MRESIGSLNHEFRLLLFTLLLNSYHSAPKTISFLSHSHKKTKQINLNNIDFEQGSN